MAMPSTLTSPDTPVRVFIVGCPRSGTTALQSALVNHTTLVGYPESNILYRFLGDLPLRRYGPDRVIGRANLPGFILERQWNQLGFTRSYDPTWFEIFLRIIEREDAMSLVPASTRSLGEAFEAFTRLMDELSGHQSWIDKSPENIFCVDFIDRYIADAIVIHIVRGGQDTVASCVSAGKKHKTFRNRFGGPTGVRRAVRYWNRTVDITLACAKRPNHHIVRYEDFAADASATVGDLCDVLGQPRPEHGELTYDLSKIATSNETWKESFASSISQAPSKFAETFSPDEQAWIDENLAPLEQLIPRKTAA